MKIIRIKIVIQIMENYKSLNKISTGQIKITNQKLVNCLGIQTSHNRSVKVSTPFKMIGMKQQILIHKLKAQFVTTVEILVISNTIVSTIQIQIITDSKVTMKDQIRMAQ